MRDGRRESSAIHCITESKDRYKLIQFASLRRLPLRRSFSCLLNLIPFPSVSGMFSNPDLLVDHHLD